MKKKMRNNFSSVVEVSRGIYLSLFSPMASMQVDDRTMEKIAKNVEAALYARYGDDVPRIAAMTEEDADREGMSKQREQFNECYWSALEGAAIDNGMEYYEDMPKEKHEMVFIEEEGIELSD